MPEYFTLAELRALPQVGDTTRYSDARCEAAAAYVVAIIERVVGTSFVARTVTETFPVAWGRIVLASPYVQSLTTLTVGGAAQTGYSAPGGVLIDGYGVTRTWPYGATITYQAGYSTVPPADIKEAALQATRARLLSVDSNAGINDRRTSLSTDQGTVNFTIAGPNMPTGYPEVDAVIVGWRDKLSVLGFA